VEGPLPPKAASERRFEIGHVLFLDIVGYSKLPIDDQSESLRVLNEAVRGTEQFRVAEAEGKLLRLPTGDGMALVFRTTPEAPARCALELSQTLKSHPELGVRMGIHCGPVNEVIDVNERPNITGAGINIAQRVMDCGDGGHILLSKRVAEDLDDYREWRPRLHDLGPCEVKHGVIVSLVNLYTESLGNPATPKKFKPAKWKPPPSAKTPRSYKRILLGSAFLALIVGVAIWQLLAQSRMKAELAKLREGVKEYPQMEAQVRGSRTDNPAFEQERIYVELGKQLGVDAKTLREKLPRFAEELKKAPDAGNYERASASYVARGYIEAERLALQAAAEARKNVPVNAKDILAALELAGLSAFQAIEYDRATLHFREAEKLSDRGRDLEEWARLQNEIADLLVAEGKYSEADKIFRSVIAARSSALGPEHPDTLDSRHRLIYALTRQTKYAEAENEARQVLKLREKVLGREHVDTVVSRYNLADTLVDQGKYPEAEELYRGVIRLYKRMFGADHPRTLSARVGLATTLGAQGKNAEAEALYREIIALDQKVYGPEHPNTLNDRMNLGTTLQADGKLAPAEREYRDVIKIEEGVIGATHPDTLTSRNNLSEVLDDEGKYAEAEIECRQIIEPEERTLGPENRVTLNSQGNLVVALIGQGKFGEAESQSKDLLERMDRVLGLEHPDTLGYTSKFVAAFLRQNKSEEAKTIAQEQAARAQKSFGPDNPTSRSYAKLIEDSESLKR
jgi:tetratricopeptide (TPR) repeat protein